MIDRRHLIQRRRYHPAWALMALMVLSLSAGQTTYAQEQAARADSEPICRGTFSRTCGAYTMYAALRLLEKHDVSLDTLVSPSYITTAQGSTAGDLIGMADHYGVPAIGFTGWRLNQLRATEHPVILEVRPDTQTREYNHWVMVYPAGGDAFVMVDPPFEPMVVSGRKIVSRWRGRGVLVGEEALSATSGLSGLTSGPVLVLLIVASSLFVLAKLRFVNGQQAGKLATRGTRRLALKQGGVIVVLACVAGLVFHMADDFGLLRNWDAAVHLQQANAANFLSRIGYESVQDDLLRGAVVIDARRQSDYTLGHLPGAVNIPVGLSAEQRRIIAIAWPKDARIVVYCQSIRCDYDERVAVSLSADGYTDIAVYEGGWVEWQSRQIQQASAN